MTRLLRAALLLAAVGAAGCGNTVDVSGRVTYEGKPVGYGTVTLLAPGEAARTGPLAPDGSFTVSGVKPGRVKVAVSSPRPPGAEDGAKKPARGRDADDDGDRKPPPTVPRADPAVVAAWRQLPEKFGDPAKSGVEVEAGSGTPVVIDLK